MSPPTKISIIFGTSSSPKKSPTCVAFRKNCPMAAWLTPQLSRLPLQPLFRPMSAMVGSSYIVHPFNPTPVQCSSKCHRIGHSSNRCMFEARCKSCGDAPHDGSACCKKPHCINCGNDSHPTGSKTCSKYIEQDKIIKLAFSKRISFPEARRLLTPSLSPLPPPPPTSELLVYRAPQRNPLD